MAWDIEFTPEAEKWLKGLRGDRRRAIVLVGGDKTNNWRGWYQQAIPSADRLYDKHLRSTGCLKTKGRGGRSAQRCR